MKFVMIRGRDMDYFMAARDAITLITPVYDSRGEFAYTKLHIKLTEKRDVIMYSSETINDLTVKLG